MTTIREVASRAGVSVATVSKYLNGVRVREKNALAIEEAVRALGFRPNEIARGLRTNRSMTVGVLLPELDNLFFTEIISNVDRVLEEAGYSTVVCVSRSDTEREERRLDFLRRKQIDGLIAVPTTSASRFVRSLGGLPTVLIDRVVTGAESESCASVLTDNFEASRSAAEELLRAGHRRIGLLTGPDSNYTPIERRAGFLAACSARGLTPDPRYLKTGDYTAEAGRRMTAELLSTDEPPTALFATNNELTEGAVRALSESGLVPGKDISFVGFDSRVLAEAYRPKLTVVLQPVEEIGRTAAHTLLRLIAGEDCGGIIRLPASVFKGNSICQITEILL